METRLRSRSSKDPMTFLQASRSVSSNFAILLFLFASQIEFFFLFPPRQFGSKIESAVPLLSKMFECFISVFLYNSFPIPSL